MAIKFRETLGASPAMKVKREGDPFLFESYNVYTPESPEDVALLGRMLAAGHIPDPGPDGLPHLKKLPRRPRGVKSSWWVETRHGNDGRDFFWVVLTCGSKEHPEPKGGVPSFDDWEDCWDAAHRSAIRLGTYVRE